MLGTIGITPEIGLAFATPVLQRVVPGHEQAGPELAAAVRAAQARDPGVAVSNAGGWQSRPDLWTWPGPALDWYRAAVDDAVRRISALPQQVADLTAVEVDYEASAWANVNRAGDYNRIHIHPTAHWAVVYYVETGAADPARPGSGQIELFDPRPLALTSRQPDYGFGRGLAFDPAPGMLLLFPAWLQHMVHPYTGEAERITIAANVTLLGGRHSGLG